MKTSVLVGRLLLGLIFVVFGLNGFLLFITPPEHTPVGNAFINLLVTSGFMYVEKAFEIIGGALLLLDLYVPLGLAVLAPIVVSILIFHLLMERNTLVIGVVPFLLWVVLAWAYRWQFTPLLVRRVRTLASGIRSERIVLHSANETVINKLAVIAKDFAVIVFSPGGATLVRLD